MSEPERVRDERREPSFGELLRANLRVVFWACALAIVAYGVWRGMRALFPELGWLQ